MGVEKFSWGKKVRYLNLVKCLVMPAIVHFAYNYSLTNIISKIESDGMLLITMILFFIPFYFIAFYYLKKIRLCNYKFITNQKYKNLMTKIEYNEIASKQY